MRVIKVGGFLALAGLLISCADQTTDPIDSPLLAMGGNSGPSASGQAFWPDFGGGDQNFSFHVRQDAEGNVSGSFESKGRGDPLFEAHAAIDCFRIEGSNEAILGGVLTQFHEPEENPLGVGVGTRFWMKVQDNGEGAGSPPDGFSDWWVGFESFPVSFCGDEPYPAVEGFVPAYIEVEKGNIQVKP